MLFQKVEGENAIVVHNGVYRQCDVYERNGSLFAKVGPGFIRLYANGSTSQTKTRLETLAYDGPLYADQLGRLTTKDGEGHKAIAVTNEGTLKIEDHR